MAPKRKLSDEKYRQLISDVIKNDMLYRQATEKYKISKATLKRSIRKAIQDGIITQKEYDDRSERAPHYSFEAKRFLHGDAEARKQCGDSGRNSLSALTETELRNMSKSGGDATRKLYSEVAGNLKNAKPYGRRICNYGALKFHSEGERFVALLLVEYGLLDNLSVGYNFQRSFGNFNVDFYIPEKNIAIEFHPVPKQHKGVEEDTLEDYVRKREFELKERGFDGRLIAIQSIAQIHSVLTNVGLTRIDRQTHFKKYQTVASLLDNYDSHGKVDKRFIGLENLEKTVSQEDDSVPPAEEDITGGRDAPLQEY